MRPNPSNLDHAGMQNHILKIRKEIEILQTSLEDCITSWRTFGFADVRNPIAESLQRDIDSRKASLLQNQEALIRLAPAEPPLNLGT
jgi:hypothetical protein